MKARTKTGRVLAALAIGSLVVAACGSDDEAAETVTDVTEAPVEESEPEVVLASEECAIPVSADAVAIDVMGWEFPIITQYAAELKECEAANYSFNIQFLDSAEAQNQINLDLETGAPSYEMVQGSNQFIVELANKGLSWRGDAELTLHDSEWDQPASLLPVREVIGGYYREVGVTFAGGTLLEDRSKAV